MAGIRITTSGDASRSLLSAPSSFSSCTNRTRIIGITVVLLLCSCSLFLLLHTHRRDDVGLRIPDSSSLSPFVEVPASQNSKLTSPSIVATVLPGAGGAGRDGYLAVVDNSAAYFHVEGVCESLQRTSTTALAAGCQYAVNGGPFNSYLTGGCIGPVLSHGKTLHTDWGSTYAAFGLTSSKHWVLGHITQDIASSRGIVELVTGFGWLVQNSKAAPQVDSKLAQRSAVGVDGAGRLILLQIDGCERCPFSGGPSGITLADFANLLVAHGVVHAINLDGGGSSTTVVNGTVVNRPDCLEIGLRCERPVASVLCIGKST